MLLNLKDRVNYVCKVILSGKPTNRKFDSCFEMFDCDLVGAMVYKRALKNKIIMERLPLYLNKDLCFKNYLENNNVTH